MPEDLRLIVAKTSVTLDYPRKQVESYVVQDETNLQCEFTASPAEAIENAVMNLGTDFRDRLIAGEPGAVDMARNLALRNRTLMLDGTTRLSILAPRSIGNLKKPARTVGQALLLQDTQRQRWRSSVYDAIGQYPLLDPTDLKNYSVSLSRVEPSVPNLERSFTDEAIEFFRKCTPLQRSSDGVRAYCGMCAAVFCADYDVIFIDEPEAFLHPPLVRRLAKLLCQTAAQQGTRIFAATHSSDFVMGCIQSGVDTNVVRMTYDGCSASAKLLGFDDLSGLMRDPLLRSAGFLAGLFHQGVIVCEADGDRAFYQEINERLLAAGKPGLDGCHFVNAQNWQTIEKILGPLRSLGIPTAGIADLDVLLNEQFTALSAACSIPEMIGHGLNITRTHLVGETKRRFSANNQGYKELKHLIKAQGLRAFGNDLQPVVEKLLSDLADYGLFLVPVGELESWLPALKVEGHAPNWLIEVFIRMGSNPSEADYCGPVDGDVWAFVSSIMCWITNRSRKGMP